MNFIFTLLINIVTSVPVKVPMFSIEMPVSQFPELFIPQAAIILEPPASGALKYNEQVPPIEREIPKASSSRNASSRTNKKKLKRMP
jgi:hypothetical protein